ncbi:MAG: lipoprotein [Rhodocyclaceae bacterium]|nr:lipoprotein [Rhodocyclaceae bacterium]
MLFPKRPVLIIALGGLLLAACGNKGGLTLPPAATTAVKPQPAKPSADDNSAAPTPTPASAR